MPFIDLNAIPGPTVTDREGNQNVTGLYHFSSNSGDAPPVQIVGTARDVEMIQRVLNDESFAELQSNL